MPPPAPERAAEMLEEWEEAVICSLLGVKGRLLHAAIGVSEQDWTYTDLDLQAIAPPLTRICNRYEPIRRYAPYADPITLVTALSAYATRSLLERKEVVQALEPEDTTAIPPAEEPPPVPPSAAPPPRQASNFPTTTAVPPAPPQPSEGPAPPPPPRPAESEVDPTALDWQVGGG